jgi:predicted PurR-regulated permease PerM
VSVQPATPEPATAPRTERVTIAFDQRGLRRSAVLVVIVVGLGLLGLWVFSVLSHFLFLLLLAWLFAVAMEPGIARLIHRGMRRGTATAVVGGVTLLCVVLFLVIFGDLFFQQLVGLVKSVPALVDSAVQWVNRTFHTSFSQTELTDKLHANSSAVAGTAAKLAGGILGIVSSLVGVVFDAFTVLVFGFYFASDGPRLQGTIASWLPPEGQRVFLTVWDITVAKTGGYVVSKIVLAGLSSLCHGIFFWAIGVPYWLPFALFVGITAQFIPVVGTYIGIAVPALFTVFVSPPKAIAIVVFAAVYQQIETYVFTPRVSKRTMDVNQAIALAAVFVGAAVWGAIGAIIGIPLAAAGVAIADTYRRRYDLVPELATLPGLAPDRATEVRALSHHPADGSADATDEVPDESAHAGSDTGAEPDS